MLEQFTLTAELKLLSPLHVGTGGLKPLKEFMSPEEWTEFEKKAPGTNPLVAEVVRDEKDRPCLPATALKGCLRAACVEAGWDKEVIKALFGEILHHEKDKGWMGRVIFRLGRLKDKTVPPALKLPYYKPDRASYVQTRHRRDPKTGTVAEGALFYQELVPAGARFVFQATFLGGRDELEATLLPALAFLARPEGVALGKGYALGQGRLRLDLKDGGLKAKHVWFDPARFEKLKEDIRLDLTPAEAAGGYRRALRLSCSGPFIIHDPARPPAKEDQEAGRTNVLRPLATTESEPALLATSLLGALRARCGWLCRLKGEEEDKPLRVLRPEAEPGELTTTERLFGVTGWRGLLRVERLEFKKPAGDSVKLVKLPQVALDRFTGGPLGTALFFVEAHLGVEFEVVLALDQRSALGGPKSPERRALDDLITDLVAPDEVLPLGHGVTNGFGWFTVKEDGHA